MTNPKGMDELLWEKDFEDVINWTKQLAIALQVYGYDELKFFKIARLNLQGKVKNQYKKLKLAPIDWNEMTTGMQQKFGDVNLDELTMKMDVVKPRNFGRKFDYILIGSLSCSRRER